MQISYGLARVDECPKLCLALCQHLRAADVGSVGTGGPRERESHLSADVRAYPCRPMQTAAWRVGHQGSPPRHASCIACMMQSACSGRLYSPHLPADADRTDAPSRPWGMHLQAEYSVPEQRSWRCIEACSLFMYLARYIRYAYGSRRTFEYATC